MTLPDERVRELVREIARLTRERDEARAILAKWDKDYEDVCDERDEARAILAKWDKDYEDVCDERDRLRALLRNIEWMGSEHETMCPSCGCMQWKGHAPDCRLAAALEGRDAAA